jgi:hypothetical protein
MNDGPVRLESASTDHFPLRWAVPIGYPDSFRTTGDAISHLRKNRDRLQKRSEFRIVVASDDAPLMGDIQIRRLLG